MEELLLSQTTSKMTMTSTHPLRTSRDIIMTPLSLETIVTMLVQTSREGLYSNSARPNLFGSSMDVSAVIDGENLPDSPSAMMKNPAPLITPFVLLKFYLKSTPSLLAPRRNYLTIAISPSAFLPLLYKSTDSPLWKPPALPVYPNLMLSYVMGTEIVLHRIEDLMNYLGI